MNFTNRELYYSDIKYSLNLKILLAYGFYLGESGLLGILAIPLIDLAINLPKVIFNHYTNH